VQQYQLNAYSEYIIVKVMAIVLLTSDEVLAYGLLAMGFSEKRILRVKKEKNFSRFRSHYVGHPKVYADLLYRLQVTDIPEAHLDFSILGKDKTIKYFFMGIYLLASYPTEERAESAFSFGPSDRTYRTHAWAIVEKIAALFPDIIVWPDQWINPANPDAGETRFIITVDGTHCKIEEPTFDDFAENKKFYSHKFKSAGLDYEVALSIFEPKCVWIAGPYPAGKNDISVFRHKLKARMLEAREASGVDYQGIGDRGYRGESELLTVPSSVDTDEVKEFKGRALARQETFNSRLKCFDCLDERFRHGIEKHALCFRACVVIVQLQMNNGFCIFSV
jgi:hypothetical protein